MSEKGGGGEGSSPIQKICCKSYANECNFKFFWKISAMNLSKIGRRVKGCLDLKKKTSKFGHMVVPKFYHLSAYSLPILSNPLTLCVFLRPPFTILCLFSKPRSCEIQSVCSPVKNFSTLVPLLSPLYFDQYPIKTVQRNSAWSTLCTSAVGDYDMFFRVVLCTILFFCVPVPTYESRVYHS